MARAMVNAIAVTFHLASSSHVRYPLATVMSLERPSGERLEAFLARRQGQAFNHPFAGCTSLEASSVCAPTQPHSVPSRPPPKPPNTAPSSVTMQCQLCGAHGLARVRPPCR